MSFGHFNVGDPPWFFNVFAIATPATKGINPAISKDIGSKRIRVKDNPLLGLINQEFPPRPFP